MARRESRELWRRWLYADPETLKKPIIICRTDGRGGFYYQFPGHASKFALTHAEAFAAVDRWWLERAS